KVMAWVAFDRACRAVTEGLPGPGDHWREIAGKIHDEVCTHGYNEKRGAFTQYYGSDELDAAVLLIPEVGFLPEDDPRVVSTVEAIARDLVSDGLVRRYQLATGQSQVDGLSGSEGAFLACSFWLVNALQMIGHEDRAHELFDKLLGLRNDVGLLSEEYDPRYGRQVGNTPRARGHGARPAVTTIPRPTQREGASGPPPEGAMADYPRPSAARPHILVVNG